MPETAGCGLCGGGFYRRSARTNRTNGNTGAFRRCYNYRPHTCRSSHGSPHPKEAMPVDDDDPHLRSRRRLGRGLFRVAAVLAQRLNRAVTDIMPALGANRWSPSQKDGWLTTYWQQVRDRARWPMTVAALEALVREIFRRPVPGMPELLTALRAHRLMLLSDQGREWMAYLDATHPFLGLFERRFLSFEMGQTKHSGSPRFSTSSRSSAAPTRLRLYRRSAVECGTSAHGWHADDAIHLY